ncbi:hypothetical protein C8024_17485 [Sphingopyxis sp. BSNA05]|uniref:hypothetical protein n=1 Tax=Sphingopyxis sp. BSNA05 TaxID=1236614 RepID=UPI001567B833|nr:hypothetical protein [Sphingopyxis sp. BSNA05]NRD90852.1 hypothetical protein [Sphingopyxis sp. BSNA05]
MQKSFECCTYLKHEPIHDKKLTLLLSILTATLLTGPAQADPADISAASRSVVRVVLAAKDGSKVAFVGHGSGFAVAPDKIVTNAHVVEIARQESSVVIGIIPSQGGPAMAEKSSLIRPAMIWPDPGAGWRALTADDDFRRTGCRRRGCGGDRLSWLGRPRPGA